jgi:alkylhydroperoxidase family enzyme
MTKRVREIDEEAAEERELLQKIKTRRNGALLNLDKVLLHSPTIAKGWNAMFGAIRSTKRALERESCILLIAVLNKADYEWEQHIQPFLNAGGTLEMSEAIKGRELTHSSLSESQQAALVLAQEMTQDVAVSDATFARVSQSFSNSTDTMELIVAIAGYNMVSRVLVATQINPEK